MSFLHNVLKIPVYNDVENIIVNIISKYKNNEINISFEDNLEDMNNISNIYFNDNIRKEDKIRLENELKEIKIISTENINGQDLGYESISNVYLKNEYLEIYFSFNIFAKFVTSKYDVSIKRLLKEIGVKENIKIIRRNSDWQNNVIITSEWNNYKRGLNNYDPDIEIDGLEENLEEFTNQCNDSTVKEKRLKFSILLWNTIVCKYSDCIRGKIEESTNQYYNNSSQKETFSKFGRMLKNTKWLPNKTGNFYKPEDLKLYDLPEEFKKNEELARLLDFKETEKDKQIELVKEFKNKYTEEQIRLIIEGLLKEEEEIFDPTIAVIEEDFPEGQIKDINRLRERIKRQYDEARSVNYEPVLRRIRTSRGNDREHARDVYRGFCQICGKKSPFWEITEIFKEPIKELIQMNLSLCPNCASEYRILRNRKNFKDEFTNIILNNDPEKNSIIDICEKKIRFRNDHLAEVQEILRIERENDAKNT